MVKNLLKQPKRFWRCNQYHLCMLNPDIQCIKISYACTYIYLYLLDQDDQGRDAYMLCDHFVPHISKIKLYKIIARPAMFYGLDYWVVQK